MTPILLLEINEVPWRLVDRYIDRPEFANVRRFFGASHQFTTVAVDSGELSPWVTWPSLHRGMGNDAHGILNLGQDPSTFRGKAIWDEVRERGESIGVCGSMQSWPPRDPGNGGFYLPDTFAHDARCIPDYISPFQDFNLEQVRGNARVVHGEVRAANKLALARSMARAGVRASTFLRVAGQLARERIEPDLRQRRPVYQAVLFWDVFRKLYDHRSPPAFSTFFTNHIAGVMHRYWSDVFPEDFPEGGPKRRSQEPLMRFALGVLDDILGDVMAWAAENPELVVVFASSMGQSAVHRPGHIGVEVVVADLAALAAGAGLGAQDYRPLLAMVPQVALDVPDAVKRKAAKAALENATCEGGKRFITVQEIGNSLSVTVVTPSRAALERPVRIAGQERSWSEAGIRREEVDPGTGYHIPEGSLAVYTHANSESLVRDRPRIPADRVKSWLLGVLEQGQGRIPTLIQAANDERSPASSHALAS
jgi:hypothetical protein